ncbi:MAG: hypothetical protein JNN07_04065 [Verrucomicrobiales bacterium]|nr:hypothetical protein [Verrucomicrobiales bacterium]
MTYLRTIILFFLVVRSGWAGLPVYEGFPYANGSPLGGQVPAGGGWTWIKLGVPADPDLVLGAGNLSYIGLPSSTGRSLRPANTNLSGARLVWNDSVGSGPLFYSVLLRLSSLSGMAGVSTVAGFDSITGTNFPAATALFGRLLVRPTAGGYQVGLGRNTSVQANASWATNVLTSSDVVYVVVGYNFIPGNLDVSRLWLNPDSSTLGAGAAPVATLTNVVGTPASQLGLSLNSLALFQGPNAPAATIVDELRVASTWATVTSTTGAPPATVGGLVETLSSFRSLSTNGFVMDSDQDSLQADPAYNREAVRAESIVLFQNTNTAQIASTYVFSYRLLDSAGLVYPIAALGSNSTNATSTYDSTNQVNLLAGASVAITNVVGLQPLRRLVPGEAYRVEFSLVEPGAGATGISASDIARVYYHFTNTVSADSVLNVIGSLDSLGLDRGFAVVGGAQPSFLFTVGATLRRYDSFSAASPGPAASVPVNFSWELRQVPGGNLIPLRQTQLSTNELLAAYLAGSPRQPVVSSKSYAISVEPASGVQLSSLSAYELRVTMTHAESTSGPVVTVTDGIQSTGAQTLLHFNGQLQFATSAGTFTSIANSPSPLGTNNAGVQANLRVSAGNGQVTGAQPPLTFGGNTTLSIRLLTNGTAQVLSGSYALSLAAPVDKVVQGFEYSVSTGLSLGAAGLLGTVELRLPQGFGYRVGNVDSPLCRSRVTFTNAPLNAGNLRPAQDLSFVEPAGIYSAEEGRPVWFQSTGFTWKSSAGVLEIVPTGVLSARGGDYETLRGKTNVLQTLSLAEKPSNDHYWDYVDVVSSATVQIRADSSHRALATYDVHLREGGGSFETHFPSDTVLSWSGRGKISIRDDLVVPATSNLPGPDDIKLSYELTCADCGAIPILPGTESITNAPVGALRFTPDGGLATPTTFSSPFDLRWGKHDGSDYAHQALDFTKAAFHMAGTMLVAESVELDLALHPTALLYASVDSATGAVVGRPGQGGGTAQLNYEDGLGDYAGLNFKPATNSTPQGRSRIANQNSGLYTLSNAAKYYVRRGGVFGRHEAIPGAFSIEGIYGYQGSISNLSVSFLNGKPFQSAIQGHINLPFPAGIDVELSQLELNCSGQLVGTPGATRDQRLYLNYWNTWITINGLAFERLTETSTNGWRILLNTSCDASDYRLTFDVSLAPVGFRGSNFTGRVFFETNGTLISKSSGYFGADSRLKGPTTVRFDGPGGSTYSLTPVCDGYLNNYDNAKQADSGWFNVIGDLNVAFFEDIPVHLHVSGGSAQSAALYLMGGWPTSGFADNYGWRDGSADFFNVSYFDEANNGKPGGTVASYRDQTTELYNPRAQKVWAEVVKFDYPLVWSSASRSFAGLAPKVKDLLVLETQSRLEYLDNQTADLTFGLKYEGLPVMNLTEMLLEESGLSAALSKVVEAQLGVFDKGLGQLGEILNADPKVFLDPILDQVLDPILDDLYDELESRYEAVSPCSFVTEADPLLNDYYLTRSGTGSSVASELKTMAGRFDEAQSVIGKTDAYLADAQFAIDAVAGTITRDADGASIGTQVGFITQQGLERATGREMVSQVLGDLAGVVVDAGITAMIDELLGDEDLPLDEIEQTLGELRDQLGDLRNRLKASGDLALNLSAVFTTAAADLDAAAQRSKQDASAYLSSFVCTVDDPFLDVAEETFKTTLKNQIKNQFYATGVPAAVQTVLREVVYDLNGLLVEAVNSAIAELNRVVEKVLDENLGGLVEQHAPLLGDLADALGAAEIKGAAVINGDSLESLRLDTRLRMALNGDQNNPEEGSLLEFAAWFQIKNDNNNGNDGTCTLGSGDATEVSLGADASIPGFLTDDFRLAFDFLFGFQPDPFKPLQVGGGFDIPVPIPVAPPFIRLTGIGGDASFGAKENYFSASADAKLIELVDATGGLMIGKTCSYKPFEGWAPEAERVIGVSTSVMERDGWAGIYTEVDMGLSLGTEGCWLRAEYGGSGGVGFRWDDPTVFGTASGYVSGDFLCVVGGGASFELLASAKLGDIMSGQLIEDLFMQGCATIEATILFVKVSPTVCITYQNGIFDAYEK